MHKVFFKFIAYVGFAFLYIPILVLIIFSFNDSKLVTIWQGFSFRWYREIVKDEQLLSAIITSLKIASISATGAVILGLLAGFALSRIKKFPGRIFFSVMISAPFIVPEVIIGFSLLLAFFILQKATGWPEERGILTIIIAHITLGMSYVTVLIQSRLSNFDKSLEETALDLGARPLKIFFSITIPHIIPSIIAGWFLSFSLSLDDLVIASFNSGPNSSTLPMYIYSKLKLGVSPNINVFATITILSLGTIGSLIYYLTQHKSSSQKSKDEI